MRKILSMLLIVTLLIGAIIPAASADQSLHGLTLERNLVRAYGDGYEYFTYDPATFNTEGTIGEMEVDLDADGAAELIQVQLTSENNVYLVIYEFMDGGWKPTTSTMLYEASFTCNIQANDVFLKQVGEQWFIFNENWYQENCMADGAAWSFRAYTYNNDGWLHTVNDYYVDGTDVYGTLDEWKTDEYLITDRPELKDYANQLTAYDFFIDGVYWANMICEQDATLNIISRVMSVQDIPYETVMNFTSANGSSLPGFRTIIIDCSQTGCYLQTEFYLSTNEPGFDELPEQITFTNEPVANESEYIIFDSDKRALTADELSGYDKDTLALIRNEILARYGYPFQKQMYRDYFGSKSWYTRNENFNYSMLTSLEMENIELIKKLEAK